jgi:hypothetical protein
MSKVDAQRALRDARYAAYAAARAAAAKAPAVTSPAAKAPVAKVHPTDAPRTDAPAQDAAGDAPVVDPPAAEDLTPLCGHRNIGNKTCRRPAGHPEKNHRYN